MKLERPPTGRGELRLSGDADRFRAIADDVQKKLKGEWRERVDGMDESYWDLEVGGQTITVHRQHYLGVSVICDDEPAKIALLERLNDDSGGGVHE